jgi:hypothetical protein
MSPDRFEVRKHRQEDGISSNDGYSRYFIVSLDQCDVRFCRINVMISNSVSRIESKYLRCGLWGDMANFIFFAGSELRPVSWQRVQTRLEGRGHTSSVVDLAGALWTSDCWLAKILQVQTPSIKDHATVAAGLHQLSPRPN